VPGAFGKGIERLCGVLAAPTARELRRLLALALRETRTAEIRLDWLKNGAERRAFLKWLKAHCPRKAQLIATCRRRVGGGEFAGDAGEELYWLMQARAAGCAWCDLEVETLRELPGKSVDGYAVPGKILLSMHDFRKTPEFPKKLTVPAMGGATAIKVAAMARSLSDSARILRLAHNSHDVVAIAMGEIGLPARVLALREGSALAYAPVGTATAPGQIALRDLKTLYRAHELTRATRVFGVIGDPIGHSLSPLLHNTGYIAARKDAVYLPFLVENLKDFLKAMPDFGVRGFSVTLPHKEKIFAHLDAVEPLAQKIGAVNTVTVCEDGSLFGSNTDYVGVSRALEKKIKLRGSRVAIYGAGGFRSCRGVRAGPCRSAGFRLCAAAGGGAQAGQSGGRGSDSARGIAHVGVRRTFERHAHRDVSPGKSFAPDGGRVKLSSSHGPHLSPHPDQTPAASRFAKDRLRFRR